MSSDTRCPAVQQKMSVKLHTHIWEVRLPRDVRLPIQATGLQWLDRIFTWTLQATSTWQNRIKSNHCILFQINRMFHFCVCVLFKFDGQNSNLKRTNKQSLLKDFFWGFLKRNIFWISLRLFKLAFITLQI